MKIKIKENALEIHSKQTPASSGYKKDTMKWRNSIRTMMEANPSRLFDVETEYLFESSFTVTNPVGKYSVSIPSYMVEVVIDDARIGMSKCGYCGKVTPTSDGKCQKGCEDKYFKPLIKD